MEEFQNPDSIFSKYPMRNLQTIYDIPNHFPQLTKGGFSQWLPRQFKQAIPKNFQLSIHSSPNSVFAPIPHSGDPPSRKVYIPKSGQTENMNSFSSRVQKDKEKIQNKLKLIHLCDELEVTVRKIPSFQIKGIPTPTHNRYEPTKTITPLRVSSEMQDRVHQRTLTGENRKKKLKATAPENDYKEQLKRKEWAFNYFMDAIRNSNGVYLGVSEARAFKFYVGPGNNSALVIRVLRSRPWWVQTDNKKEANLVWTCLKHHKTLKTLEGGNNIKLEKASHIQLPRKKILDCHKFGLDLVVDSSSYKKLEACPALNISLKVCNKLEENEHIASKKLMFSNMKHYYSKIGKSIFDIVPVTFHVKSANDPEFLEFEKFYNSNLCDAKVWIVKPGENTNRGKGISVANTIEEIRALVTEKSHNHTCIVQRYIERPLLINKRKFDIRCFALLTSINSVLQGYFYTEGYIRTSSKEFTVKNLDNKFIHLTNDAVQKNSEDYGKFEPANKMSYSDLQNYLNQTFPKVGVNFEKDILTVIKKTVTETFKSVAQKIDPMKRLHCFELFGYDFMIDEDFHVWLIEANTNPCLETSCAFLSRIIPACIDNTFRIVLDPLFPPPNGERKTSMWMEEVNLVNKFELVFNELIDVE